MYADTVTLRYPEWYPESAKGPAEGSEIFSIEQEVPLLVEKRANFLEGHLSNLKILGISPYSREENFYEGKLSAEG